MSFNDSSGYVRQPSNPNDFCATSPVCMNLSGNQDPNAGIAGGGGMSVPYSSSVVVRQMIDFWAPHYLQFYFGGAFAGNNCLNCRGGVYTNPGFSLVVWEYVSIVRERVVTTTEQRDVYPTESSETDQPICQTCGEKVNDGTIFLGGGISVTASIFGKDIGFEGSLAGAITLGPNVFDVGIIFQRGTPTDDLPIAVNLGADVTFGVLNRSLEAMEGAGEAINLVVPVFIAPVSASVSEFMTPSGEILGGQVGVGTPGFGISVTKTRTSTLSLRRGIRQAQRQLTEAMCQLDSSCQ